MITDLNCVDCEIHVIKLEVNFTGLWGGIFSTLPSLVFAIELSAHAGLSFYIGNVLFLVLVFQLLLLVQMLKASHTSLSYGLLILSLPFFSCIFPSKMLFPTTP